MFDAHPKSAASFCQSMAVELQLLKSEDVQRYAPPPIKIIVF